MCLPVFVWFVNHSNDGCCECWIECVCAPIQSCMSSPVKDVRFNHFHIDYLVIFCTLFILFTSIVINSSNEEIKSESKWKNLQEKKNFDWKMMKWSKVQTSKAKAPTDTWTGTQVQCMSSFEILSSAVPPLCPNVFKWFHARTIIC